MNPLEEEKGSGGAMVKEFLKNLKSLNFLGMLHTLKVMLQSLTELSKTFQSGAIYFSRIVPNVLKTKINFTNFLAVVKLLIYRKMSTEETDETVLNLK